MNKTYDLPKGFVIILAMLTSISPLAVDTYLPSFLQISQSFSTSIANIEQTLSVYLLGLAIGQLFGGPLSDKYGRKRFIFVGIFIYILFSILISFSTSIEQMLIFRFFQAIGGGFAIVNTNAIVRDIYHGNKAAKVFSIISMIMMIAPMLAPAIGSVIVSFYTWNMIFVFMAFYAFVLSFLISKLPETSPKTKKSKPFSNYAEILKDKKSIYLILANGFSFSGLFIFIGKSSFIYMDFYKVGVNVFPILFGLNVVTLIIFSKLNIKLLETKSSLSLFKTAVFFQLLCAVLLVATINIHSLYLTLVLIMIYVGLLGMIFANSSALLLEDYKHISASANALNGVAGFFIASVCGYIASLFHDGSLYPVFIMMFLTALIAIINLNIFSRKK